MNEEAVKAIAAELTKAYLMAHRPVPETSLGIVAASIADAVPSITAENAHDIFRRALQVEAIPTVPTLVTAARNHHAENYGGQCEETRSIEYRDPRAAWLPKNPVMRAINVGEAVKNYCIACGGNSYANLCSARVRGKEAYSAFTREIKASVKKLYEKYWRKCPIANGYPYNAEISLSLIPATVEDFREMFRLESVSYA